MWHRTLRTLTAPEKFALFGLIAILGVTLVSCVAGAVLLRRHLIRHDAAIVSDLVSDLITRMLPLSYFEGGVGAASDRIAPAVAGVVSGTDIVRLNIYDRKGVVLWSDDATLLGRRVSESRELTAALRGELTADVFNPGREPHHETLRGYARLAEIMCRSATRRRDRSSAPSRSTAILPRLHAARPGAHARLGAGWRRTRST
jgi:hypothetical protein